MLRIITDKEKRRDIIEYAIIIALYYMTGGAFSYTDYSLKVILMFVCMVVFTVINKNVNNRLSIKNAMFFLMLESMFSLITLIVSQDENVTTYIAIPMQVAIGMLVAYNIGFERFVEKYIRIIVFFAAVSLIGFLIGMIYPSIIYLFPVTEGEASVDYYNAGIYVFMKLKGYAESATVITSRNAGICWEPGCYQVFLNIGIIFLLAKQRKEKDKNFYLKFMVLVMTLLTTFSTTGYLILIISIITNLKIVSEEFNRHKKTSFTAITLLIIFIVVGSKLGIEFDYIFEKTSGELDDGGEGVIDRISLDKIKYLFADGNFYFFGMGYSKWLTYNQSMWNSIIHTMLCMGIPFASVLLYMYYEFGKIFKKNSVIIFVVLIMSFCTETLFWRTFFTTLAFYGVLYSKIGYKF